jgi:Ca2+-binding RTX toxin-like protein
MTAIAHRSIPAAAGMLAAALAVVLPASPAAASATCSFDDASGTMSISMPADGDAVPIFTQLNGDISFNFEAGRCGDSATQPTVTNTDRIVVTGDAGRQELSVLLADGPLAPGATDEAGASDEIEVDIDLGGGTDDRVIFYGSFAAEQFRISPEGINANAGEVDGQDVDVTLTGVEILEVFASRGADVVDATGYAGIVRLFGQEGNDTLYGGLGLAIDTSKLDGGTENDRLVGGPGIDRMNGFYGNDTLLGNGGDDLFETGALADGADTIKGGPGVDGVTYLPRTTGVSLSLDNVRNDGQPGENDSIASDVENLAGSKGNDTIRGNGKANELRGLSGNDTLDGSGANDRLEGDEGNDDLTGGAGVDSLYGAQDTDALHAVDGNADLADGGTGSSDTCDCDPQDIRRNLP